MKIRVCLFRFLISFVLVCCFSSAGNAVSVDFSAPESIFSGEPFLVSLSSSAGLSGVEVVWQERTFSCFTEDEESYGDITLMLGTDTGHVSEGSHLIRVSGMAGEEVFGFSWQVRVMSKNYPAERLSVERSMVTPPEKLRSRINREQEEVKKALDTETGLPMWSLPFSMPLEGVITSSYGKKRIYNGVPKSRHGGVDLRAGVGTPVRAVVPGRVLLADHHYFAGKSIYLDHGNGVVSMYFHLSGMNVEPGQMVKRGEIIGFSGSTGRVTGPHLHFGVSVRGEMIDPMLLMKVDEVQMTADNRSIRFSP